jgi:hypothetical protein
MGVSVRSGGMPNSSYWYVARMAARARVLRDRLLQGVIACPQHQPSLSAVYCSCNLSFNDDCNCGLDCHDRHYPVERADEGV